MPRQNRVDPFGNLQATPDRGMLMGNRGSLHVYGLFSTVQRSDRGMC